MESYADISPLWDLSQPTTFSQLPDDDFLALLQKQFPSSPASFSADFGGLGGGVNPQTISRYSLPSLTPPSEDSSPSPPGQESGNKSPADDHDLKRKASDDDFDDEGPSQKTQHTLNGKKGTSRRKSSGGNVPAADDSRLQKRKEQNRAAQRAFRERKEKHVKDLEDKVAALEAKNDQATSENENLRDLLSRLQNENVALKQSQQSQPQQQFTFTVPKPSGSVNSTPSLGSVRSPGTNGSPNPGSSSNPNPLDWSSLTTFDPAMLSLLDDTPQPTATDGAMQIDFGFGTPGQSTSSNSAGSSSGIKQYTTIASNPMFTSFTSAFDSAPSYQSPPAAAETSTNSSSSSNNNNSNNNNNNNGLFNFDLNSLSAWSTPNPDNSFDDLFGGFMGSNPMDFNDFNVLMNSPAGSSISPVTHHATLSNTNMAARSPANSTTSSSSKSSDPLFNTPRESSSDSDPDDMPRDCPKTKSELRAHISDSGASPFAQEATAMTLRKKTDSPFGPSVMCEGSAFPSTTASDQNMEILQAWRTVTSNPQFRDSDIAELCSEFSSKARCDGTKVVLEPQGVRTIIEGLTAKHNRN